MADGVKVTIVEDEAQQQYKRSGIDRLFGPFMLGLIVQIAGTTLMIWKWPGTNVVPGRLCVDTSLYGSCVPKADRVVDTGDAGLAYLGMGIAGLAGMAVMVLVIAMGVVLGMRARASEIA